MDNTPIQKKKQTLYFSADTVSVLFECSLNIKPLKRSHTILLKDTLFVTNNYTNMIWVIGLIAEKTHNTLQSRGDIDFPSGHAWPIIQNVSLCRYPSSNLILLNPDTNHIKYLSNTLRRIVFGYCLQIEIINYGFSAHITTTESLKPLATRPITSEHFTTPSVDTIGWLVLCAILHLSRKMKHIFVSFYVYHNNNSS